MHVILGAGIAIIVLTVITGAYAIYEERKNHRELKEFMAEQKRKREEKFLPFATKEEENDTND